MYAGPFVGFTSLSWKIDSTDFIQRRERLWYQLILLNTSKLALELTLITQPGSDADLVIVSIEVHHSAQRKSKLTGDEVASSREIQTFCAEQRYASPQRRL